MSDEMNIVDGRQQEYVLDRVRGGVMKAPKPPHDVLETQLLWLKVENEKLKEKDTALCNTVYKCHQLITEKIGENKSLKEINSSLVAENIDLDAQIHDIYHYCDNFCHTEVGREVMKMIDEPE